MVFLTSAPLQQTSGTEPRSSCEHPSCGASHQRMPREAQNEPLRAQQLRIVLERLGPAYVKIAQAVSTRVDILSPAYLMEVELLQDRVPPFPTPQVFLST